MENYLSALVDGLSMSV